MLCFSGLLDLSRHISSPWFGGTNFTLATGSSIWPQIHKSSGDACNIVDQSQRFYGAQPSGGDFLTHKPTGSTLDTKINIPDIVACGDRVINNVDVHAATTSSQRALQVCCLLSSGSFKPVESVEAIFPVFMVLAFLVHLNWFSLSLSLPLVITIIIVIISIKRIVKGANVCHFTVNI